MTRLARHPHASAVAMLLALVACAPDGATDEPTDGDPAAWTIAGTAAITIGVTDGAPEYLLQNVREVRLLPDGGVAIADGGSPPIRVYGADGAYAGGIGGRGEGPGEFLDIGWMRVVAPDTIEAYDWRTFRLSRFLSDGTPVSSRQFIAAEGRPELYLGRLADGDHAFAWISAASIDPQAITTDTMRLGRYGPDGMLREVLHAATGLRRFARGPVPFSPRFHAAVVRDSILFTDGLRPEIVVLDPAGAIARSIAVPVEAPDAGAANAAVLAELGGEPDSDTERVMRWTAEQFEAVPGRDVIPHLSAMLVDDRDRLWVKRYSPATDNLWTGFPGGTGGEWWILDPDGTVVATVRAPDGLHLTDVRGDRVAGVTRDELGVERVAVYEISP